MKKTFKYLRILALALGAATALMPEARALTYTNQNLEAMLCFRKQGGANPFDLEVNLGPVTNYLALAIGQTTNLTQYTTNQLVDAIGGSDFSSVKFSVTATVYFSAPDNYPVAPNTTWATIARANPAVPVSPYARSSYNALQDSGGKIYTIGNQARLYNGTVGPDNTTTVASIPPGNSISSCETYLGSSGNLAGSYVTSVEKQAPTSFSNSVIADFYMNVPTTYPDPIAGGATTGNASYVGYFTFNADGTMTFTRSILQPSILVQRSGTTSTISFPSVNGATYSLFFTNIDGLSMPTSTWPSTGSLPGDGTTKQFIDITGDASRIYRVGGH